MTTDLSKLKEAMEYIDEDDLVIEQDSFIDVLKHEIVSNDTYTISIFYVPETGKAHLVTKGKIPKTMTEEMRPENYLKICKDLGIQENNDYNHSVSRRIGKTYARIFAITRPISEYPNITISTSKNPPSEWKQAELIDVLNGIMDDNFIIVGTSGAGKTYLMNYMLKKKHTGSDSKIALIEEFSELYVPNNGTFRLSVPTAKPNQPRLLEFITEQSNLMRMDFLYVGEVKGPEAWAFLNNLASGTKGATTVHGSSVRDGLDRFRNLCMLSGAPEQSISHAIAKTLKYVIYVRDHEIKHIAKLSGVHQGNAFQMTDIYINPTEKKERQFRGI